MDIGGHGGLRLGPTAATCCAASAASSCAGTRCARAGHAGRKTDGDDRRHARPAGALFEALRAKRLALAKAQGVPPYVIFHDSTLLAMAAAKPHDLEALAQVPGVGEAKLMRYGAEFLATIAGFQAG